MRTAAPFSPAVAVLVVAAAFAAAADAQERIVVPLSPCEAKRPLDTVYVQSSRNLVRKGTVDVDGTAFDIYLPREKGAYSRQPRPERAKLLATITSTCLAVDQDHDGTIDRHESCFAEFPLRLGDAMFDIEDLAADGSSITLQRSSGPLVGAVAGRRASLFEWTTSDGRRVDNATYANRVLVIDCWSPG